MPTIRLLTTDPDLLTAYPIMAELRDRIRRETFLPEIRLQQQGGYHLAALFPDSNPSTPVALAGFRHAHTLSRGPHLFVDDLITTATARAQGHATTLLRYLARRALDHHLPRIYLDSRDTARTYYAQVGFTFSPSIPAWIDPTHLLNDPQ